MRGIATVREYVGSLTGRESRIEGVSGPVANECGCPRPVHELRARSLPVATSFGRASHRLGVTVLRRASCRDVDRSLDGRYCRHAWGDNLSAVQSDAGFEQK